MCFSNVFIHSRSLPKTLWQYQSTPSSIIECQMLLCLWPMWKTRITLRDYWLKQPFEIFLVPKASMRSLVTERAFLDRCKWSLTRQLQLGASKSSEWRCKRHAKYSNMFKYWHSIVFSHFQKGRSAPSSATACYGRWGRGSQGSPCQGKLEKKTENQSMTARIMS